MARLTAANQQRFVKAVEATGVISQAARLTKLSRKQHYTWMLESPEYRQQIEDALKTFADMMELELFDRIANGTEEALVYAGQIQYKKDANGALTDIPLTVRKKSDLLLVFGLKALKPHYRDNFRAEITTAGAAAPTLDLSKLSEAQYEQLAKIIDALTSSRPGYVNGVAAGTGAPGPK